MQTKSFEHVTNRQGVRLADFAREAGVSREEFSKFLRDEEKKEKFFNEMKKDNKWFEKLEKEARKVGARLYQLEVNVDYTNSHDEVKMSYSSRNKSFYYDVLKVGDKYQSLDNKVVKEVLVLLNDPRDGYLTLRDRLFGFEDKYHKVVNWGLSNGLLRTNPYEVFVVGEHFIKLNFDLGPKSIHIVETTGSTFHGHSGACSVSWSDSNRKPEMLWETEFSYGRNWFAFRKFNPNH